MKKLISIVVAVLISIISAYAQNRMVTTAINLRVSSSTNSTVLCVIPQEAHVLVICDLPSGWSLVKYNYHVGYVYSSYLKAGGYYYSSPTSSVRYYTNSFGERVQSPTHYPSAPEGAIARCADGTYSFSRNRRGTCSHHGGVAQWL